ncbi:MULTISPECIES: hypothetical protein [Stenotrophomonas]|jgi:hypothetical protein|uniref:hypothetical protein n=1 Tax=Stenotrophomonas sp. PS02300 TaxID=2991426 RepID=UPI00249B44A5|nr:hypothetical protein [Stenotrophomonas sp. PS02300]
MWLQNILGRVIGGRTPSLELALTVEKRPSAFSGKAFREFTPPANLQRGGSLRLGARNGGRLGRIGIIPATGVKVP